MTKNARTSDALQPTISVDAGNDGPPKEHATIIGVTGSNFPPGKAEIRVEQFHATVPVDDEGFFDWGHSVKPKLDCGSIVCAIVQGEGGIIVKGEAEVFCP